jgi:hypothetical protein
MSMTREDKARLLTDSYHPPCQTRGMCLDKMTLEEVQALPRLLAEWEREEMELLMQEGREAEWDGGALNPEKIETATRGCFCWAFSFR